MPSFKLKDILEKVNNSLRNPLIKSMVTVAVIGVVIKAIAFYKETIIASSFGLGEALDTFMIAILVPTFIQSVFINSLKNIFIPNYIAELKNDGNKGSFQSIIFIITIIISLISVLIAYFSIDIILDLVYPGKETSYYILVKKQLNFVLPALFLWGMSSMLGGLLEVANRFLISTLAELFSLLTMIFFLIFLIGDFGQMVLAYGTLAGSIVGFIYLLFFSIKFNDFEISKPVMNDNSRLMVKQLPPKISSSFLSAMNNYIDQFFVGSLVAGSISALRYGNSIPAFGVTIVIMAIGSVILPHFSRLVNEDLKSAYHQLFKTLKIILGAGLVVVAIGIFMSDWFVELWLERGEFTHQDTLKVSGIQQILLISVPFNLCTLIMVKFLTSINKNKFMAWVSLVNLAMNIILNIILMKYYEVYGLVMSTTIVLMLGSVFYFSYTYKQYKKIR